MFIGRRQGEKLQPLVDEIEAAGGRVVARGLDARKEDAVNAFLQDADQHAPLEVCIFNIGANATSRSSTPPNACSARSGKWPARRAF